MYPISFLTEVIDSDSGLTCIPGDLYYVVGQTKLYNLISYHTFDPAYHVIQAKANMGKTPVRGFPTLYKKYISVIL